MFGRLGKGKRELGAERGWDSASAGQERVAKQQAPLALTMAATISEPHHPALPPLRSIPALLRQTAQDWMDNNALRLSAALAYYSIFSIAPLLVLAIGLAGWFFGAEAVRGQVEWQLRDLVGAEASQAVQAMIKQTSQSGQSLTATIVGLATLLLGASGVFSQLKDALNTIWGVKTRSGPGWRLFIQDRLLSFGMVLVIGFLLLVSLLVTTTLSAFDRWVSAIIHLPAWVWGGVGILVSLAIVSLLFALIFKVLPDVSLDWHHVWVGAVATGLLFEAGKFGLALYLGREGTVSSFGAAGSLVLLLLWVYYASAILLFGAEFTKAYASATGATITAKPLAKPVTAHERAREGVEPHGELPPAEPVLREEHSK